MSCYYGLATSQNRAMWATFLALVVIGAVMLPLGLSKFAPCYKEYKRCQDQGRSSSNSFSGYGGYSSSSSEISCRANLTTCGATWSRVFIVGVLCLVFASIPLCYFACCSKSPEDWLQQQQQIPTAIALQPYPQAGYPPPPPGMYPLPATHYPPPGPGGPTEALGIPITGYPAPGTVPYGAVPPPGDGQQQQQQQLPPGAYYYYQQPPYPPPTMQPGGGPNNAFAGTPYYSPVAATAVPQQSQQPPPPPQHQERPQLL